MDHDNCPLTFFNILNIIGGKGAISIITIILIIIMFPSLVLPRNSDFVLKVILT